MPSQFRLRAGIVVVAVLSLLTPATSAQTPPDGEARSREIQELLDRRSAAVRAHDRNGFVDTLDPSAPTFREAQLRWFDGAQAIPLAAFELTLDLDRLGELTREVDRKRYGAPVVVGHVEQRMGIEGFDVRPALDDLYYSFVQRDGRWRIASDTDVEDVGLRTARQPWEFGPVELRRSAHFLMLVHPAEARLADGLLRLAESALPAVDRTWTSAWPGKVPIFVPSSGAELERLLGAPIDVTHFVAFASAMIDRSGGWDLTGVRVLLNPSTFLTYGPDGRRSIFTHELFHVATRGAAGPFIPAFLEEGFAQLAEVAGSSQLARLTVGSARIEARLPEDEEFSSGDGQEISSAYRRSLSAILYLRDRFGVEGVNRFYQRYGAARVEPGTAEHHLERALAEALGITRAQFEEGWRATATARAS
ncbi:MAG: hypothetical protein ACRDJ4_12865 [Actinomycetota bacterium]